MPVRTGEHVAADEVCVSGSDDEPASVDVQTTESKRKKLHLFSTTNIQTRFCLAFEMADHKDGFNATNLLKDTKKQAGKIPAVFISDGLPSYSAAHRAVFAAKNPLDKHSVHKRCLPQQQNNFQERFNGTFRRFQSRQHISNPDSPLIMGFFVYYNHFSLHKRTPAAGVIIHCDDEWKTIIDNTSLAARAKEARS